MRAASSSGRTSVAPSRWLRFAVTSGLVFGLVGPAIGFASLLVWGAVSGRMFDSRSHEDVLSVLGGFALLLPAAYLLAFVPAALTGVLVSPALSLGRRRLFAVASPLVGAALSCLIVPLVSGQHGGWFHSVVQNAPWVTGCGAAAGLGCALITLKVT